MLKVNMLKAKNSLSRLVEAVESGAEAEVIIARNGKPAAKIVPIQAPSKGKRPLGLLEGKYPPMTLEQFNSTDSEIARMFGIEE